MICHYKISYIKAVMNVDACMYIDKHQYGTVHLRKQDVFVSTFIANSVLLLLSTEEHAFFFNTSFAFSSARLMKLPYKCALSRLNSKCALTTELC